MVLCGYLLTLQIVSNYELIFREICPGNTVTLANTVWETESIHTQNNSGTTPQ